MRADIDGEGQTTELSYSYSAFFYGIIFAAAGALSLDWFYVAAALHACALASYSQALSSKVWARDMEYQALMAEHGITKSCVYFADPDLWDRDACSSGIKSVCVCVCVCICGNAFIYLYSV